MLQVFHAPFKDILTLCCCFMLLTPTKNYKTQPVQKHLIHCSNTVFKCYCRKNNHTKTFGLCHILFFPTIILVKIKVWSVGKAAHSLYHLQLCLRAQPLAHKLLNAVILLAPYQNMHELGCASCK